MEEQIKKPMGRPKKVDEPVVLPNTRGAADTHLSDPAPSKPKEETVSVTKADWDRLQEQIKMLTEVADKGRMFNYESQKAKSTSLKVQISIFDGKYIIGWRTLKDVPGVNPLTGKATWGNDRQEYELLLLDKDGNKSSVTVDGYPAFSNARYDKRVECQVVNKKQDYNGKFEFDVRLPDDRVITLDGAFVN